MAFLNKVNLFFKKFINTLLLIVLLTLLVLPFSTLTSEAIALDANEGERIYLDHCAGCHINGGNIVRRNKTLRLKDLKRNGLDSPEAIAKIAKEGIGIMSGYEKFLKNEEDKILANWIWEQSQNAWVHG